MGDCLPCCYLVPVNQPISGVWRRFLTYPGMAPVRTRAFPSPSPLPTPPPCVCFPPLRLRPVVPDTSLAHSRQRVRQNGLEAGSDITSHPDRLYSIVQLVHEYERILFAFLSLVSPSCVSCGPAAAAAAAAAAASAALFSSAPAVIYGLGAAHKLPSALNII